MHRYVLFLLLSCGVASAQQAPPPEPSIADALAAERSGDHQKAAQIYLHHAEKGDTTAMVTLGLMHQEGRGVKKDDCAAMGWYQKVLEKRLDGDAFNNLGVMHRDGLCAPANRKIAYVIFLLIHMRGLGTESTQYRANKNLRREIAELSEADRKEALCYTGPYLSAYVKARGQLATVPDNVLPSEKNVRFKEANFWTPAERKGLEYACPQPWTEKNDVQQGVPADRSRPAGENGG